MTVDQDRGKRTDFVAVDESSRSSLFYKAIDDLVRTMNDGFEGEVFHWTKVLGSGRQVSANLNQVLRAPTQYCSIHAFTKERDSQLSDDGVVIVRKRIASKEELRQRGGGTFVGSLNRDIADFFLTYCQGLEAGLDPGALEYLVASTAKKMGQRPSNKDLINGDWAIKFRLELASQMGIRLFTSS